jgi:hypothetical protein
MGMPCRRGVIAVVEAGHPVPDANSEAAARRILAAVQGLRSEDLVLALISGGASAVMALPAPGMTLADKAAITGALLRSGATVGEINAVRRHVSAIKGGRLAAAAAPARVVTLAISDVPGDDPAVIGSGPTVANATDAADVLAILARYGICLPDGANPLPAVRHVMGEFRLVATPAMALRAAADDCADGWCQSADPGGRARRRGTRGWACAGKCGTFMPAVRNAGGSARSAALGRRDDRDDRQRGWWPRRAQYGVLTRDGAAVGGSRRHLCAGLRH